MTGIIAVLVAGAAVDASEQVPAATVTLLLVGIERLTQPVESGPEAMMAAMARLEVVAGETITRHRGARRNGHGDDDGFMVSFSRTSDALLQDNRLVTLTGAGGVGKTRLALQVAAKVLTWFPAGVWHVDLARSPMPPWSRLPWPAVSACRMRWAADGDGGRFHRSPACAGGPG